jgi:hypothetical protein
LAGLPGLPESESAVIRKAKAGVWPSRPRQGQGGGKEYPLNCLPEETQEHLKKAQARDLVNSGADEEAAVLCRMGLNPENETIKEVIKAGKAARRRVEKETEERLRMKELSLARFNQLPEEKQRSGNARRKIMKACAAFLIAAGQKPGNQKWMEIFAVEYNAGTVQLPEWVRETIPNVTARTIYRWEQKYNSGGMYALANGYTSNAGTTMLTREQQDLAIAMQVQFPGCSIKKVLSALEARGMEAHHDSVSRFLKHWHKMNASLYLFLTNPDEWRNKHMLAFGSSSEAVTRLNQVWEMDSTPADLLFEDGRYAVIGCIDVYTRRPRLLVSPTSKATAVAALLRRCIIEWGVLEVLKTDNGKDYVAAHIERIVEALEVEHSLCPPFTPECKPHIERFFHTFSHGIVELLPGFIGHSVADRKAIEARRSFADRLMKRGGDPVEVKLTSLEFQKICDRWVDAIYMHDTHEGLNGKTPAEMVREWTSPIRVVTEVRALDVLLHPAPKDGGFRTITKKGVEVDTRFYQSIEFGTLVGTRVRVQVDDTDLAHAYIYTETGEFICTAECREWAGISNADLASHAKAKQKAIMQEQRREFKELARKAKAETVPEDILRYREDRIATIAEFPKQTVPYITPALEEAAKAVKERDTKANIMPPERYELPSEVLAGEARREQKVISLAESRKLRDVTSPTDVYYMILDRIKEGTVTPYQQQWKKDYEYWEDSTKKVGLLKEDPYCLRDPDEKKDAKQENNQ